MFDLVWLIHYFCNFSVRLLNRDLPFFFSLFLFLLNLHRFFRDPKSMYVIEVVEHPDLLVLALSFQPTTTPDD